MEYREKEVDFHKYCPLCKHKDKGEEEDPCYDCLAESFNIDSRKPVYFEEKRKER